jgi:hypothetical protein
LIIYGGLAFAEEQGLKTEKEFIWTQYVLEADTEGIPLIQIDFGDEDDLSLLTDIHINIFMEYANHKRITLEEHYKKPFREIIEDKEVNRKMSEMMDKA